MALAIAVQMFRTWLVEAYRVMPAAERLEFFRTLAADYAVSAERVKAAATRYAGAPEPGNLDRLRRAIESPRSRKPTPCTGSRSARTR